MTTYQSSQRATAVSRPTIVTGPTTEPVTLAEVRRQLFLSPSDTSNDQELTSRIQAAREQWEHDTDSAMLSQTLSVTLERFCGLEIELPSRPIQSVTHVKYYDGDNSLQTFSSASYSLNKPDRKIVLNWDASWPTTYDRWDSVVITYVAGYATAALIPAIAKQAMLLNITYNQYGNRGDNDRPNDQRAYEALVRRYMRSTYP